VARPLGFFLNDVIHNRHIVGSEVPDYVNVMLEESKVYSSGIEVIQVSEDFVIDKFPDFPHRTAE